MRRYLIDENLSPAYRTQLLYHGSSLTVLGVGDEGAPARSTKDPEILKWCEENKFTLVTNDRKTIPKHLADHLASGHHVLGVFMIKRNVSMGAILEELVRIAENSHEDEFLDQLIFIPL